jgi:hypothetical protein
MLFKKLDTNELILANDDLAKDYLKDRNYRVARDSDIEPKDDSNEHSEKIAKLERMIKTME